MRVPFSEASQEVERELARQQAKPGADVGIGGADGRKVQELLSRSLREGTERINEITRAALTRLLDEGGAEAVLSAASLFSDEEKEQLADVLASIRATADLLGASRIAQRAEEAEATGSGKFAEGFGLHLFDEPLQPLKPQQAWEFFKNLVPKLGTDPERLFPSWERQAFTLAVATDETLLTRVQDIITNRLETGQDIRGAEIEVEELLDEAGVTPKNPQYAEMVVRTNLMDSYNTGADRERAAQVDVFPVYLYSNPSDGRSRPEHAQRNGKYYPATVPFAEVRGLDISDAANCRCVPIEVWAGDWEELKKAGARVESGPPW